MATWYRPANPGASAVPYTVAEIPPTVTVTLLVTEYVAVDGTSTPTGAAGLVGPKPVPHRIKTSPGLAGTVAEPNSPFFTAQL